MDWYTLSVVALVLAAFGAKLGRSFRSGPRLRTLERFARQAGLARAPEIERALIRRTTARERGYTIGIMAAVAGIGLWSITGATAASSGFLLAAIAMIGAVVGRGVAEWRSAFTPVPDQPRIARATTPGLADYVSPLERLATPAVILSAIALLGAAAFAGVAPSALLPSIVIVIAAIAAAAVSHVASVSLLGRGQPAASVTELVWDDALRSATLRSLFDMAAILGATSLSLSLFASETVRAMSAVTTYGMPLLSTIVLAFTIVTNLRQHTTRYLRRLWPDLAAEHAQALTRGAAV